MSKTKDLNTKKTIKRSLFYGRIVAQGIFKNRNPTKIKVWQV